MFYLTAMVCCFNNILYTLVTYHTQMYDFVENLALAATAKTEHLFPLFWLFPGVSIC